MLQPRRKSTFRCDWAFLARVYKKCRKIRPGHVQLISCSLLGKVLPDFAPRPLQRWKVMLSTFAMIPLELTSKSLFPAFQTRKAQTTSYRLDQHARLLAAIPATLWHPTSTLVKQKAQTYQLVTCASICASVYQQIEEVDKSSTSHFPAPERAFLFL